MATPNLTHANPPRAFGCSDNRTAASRRLASALDALRAGRLAVLVSEDGLGADVVASASRADADVINFMATHARGLIRLALPPERCDALALGLLPTTEGARSPAYTISIEAREGVKTGISAADRARTVAAVVDPAATAHDLVRPGHMFPIRTAAGGSLANAGQAEAALDLVRLTGDTPAAVLCHVLDDDGALATDGLLDRYADEHDIQMVTVGDVVGYLAMLEGGLRSAAAL